MPPSAVCSPFLIASLVALFYRKDKYFYSTKLLNMIRFLMGALTLLFANGVFAQSFNISGKVTGAADNEPLIGATVVLKGTTTGTITDLDGNFQFSIPESAAQDSLLVSFVGFKSAIVPIAGREQINISLSDDAELLGEVVVTAIGIAREKRSLGYAVNEVKSEEISDSRETDVIRAMNAKVPGVQITGTSGSPGASSNIVIRGNTSGTASNSPLFIIDGIPIDNSYRGSNFTDQANRVMDLNPEDIESISVLKGGAAAALYGVKAGNGVVVINTKKGKSGISEVTFSSTTLIDRVNKLPPIQRRFAQGSGGNFVPTSQFSWGPRLDTMRYNGIPNSSSQFGHLVGQSSPLATDREAQAYDNASRVFQTGVTLNNNLSFRGGNDVSGYFLSLGDVRQTGIIPNSEFNRTSVRVSGFTKVGKHFKAEGAANYIAVDAERTQRGSNLSGVTLGLFRAPPSYDLTNGSDDPVNDPTAFELPDGSQRTYFSNYDNPFWSVNRNRNREQTNRMMGHVEFSYQPKDWISVTNRTGLDHYNTTSKAWWDSQSGEFRAGGGLVINNSFTNTVLNNDLLVTLDHSFSENFRVTFIAGHNYRSEYNNSLYAEGEGFIIPGFYDLSNTPLQNQFVDDFIQRERAVGLYGDLNLSFWNWLYLHFTGRNDWLSNLPENRNSFFYPSTAVGLVFTDMLDMQSSVLPYGKLRASYSNVGNGAPIIYGTNPNMTFVGTNDGQGLLSFYPDAMIGNVFLTPQNTTTWEIGTDLRLFQNRIGVDLTYFNAITTDQIELMSLPPSSGFSSQLQNIGKVVNQGIELLLTLQVLESNSPKKLGWESTINFTRLRNMVEELTETIDFVTLTTSGLESTSSIMAAGNPFGAFYGSAWARDDNGNILVDDNGYPIVDGQRQIIGDPNPKFTAGWRNTFSYRNFDLTFLLDIRVGGDMYNGTRGVMNFHGTHADTDAREDFIVWDGVVASTGEVNTQEIKLDQDFYSRYGLVGVSEYNVERDINWFRMRDVSLAYRFPRQFMKKLPVRDISLAITARNLFLITNYTGIDPETSLSGAANSFGRDYFNNPNTRSFGFNLKVTI